MNHFATAFTNTNLAVSEKLCNNHMAYGIQNVSLSQTHPHNLSLKPSAGESATLTSPKSSKIWFHRWKMEHLNTSGKMLQSFSQKINLRRLNWISILQFRWKLVSQLLNWWVGTSLTRRIAQGWRFDARLILRHKLLLL